MDIWMLRKGGHVVYIVFKMLKWSPCSVRPSGFLYLFITISSIATLCSFISKLHRLLFSLLFLHVYIPLCLSFNSLFLFTCWTTFYLLLHIVSQLWSIILSKIKFKLSKNIFRYKDLIVFKPKHLHPFWSWGYPKNKFTSPLIKLIPTFWMPLDITPILKYFKMIVS